MSFERLWLLPLAGLPLAWAAWRWRSSLRRGALILKALALASILLALAAPSVTVQETKMALAVLADTSASLSPQDLERASGLATRIEGSRGRHWAQVIPFAAATRAPGPGERAKGWKLQPTGGEAGRGTNLEAAIREGMAQLPAGLVPRLALISDGHENQGSAARAAWQARQLGIPIDTFALAGRRRPELRLESASLPAVAFTGEQFPIDVTLHSPRSAAAVVEIAAGGKVLGTSQVTLERGLNQVRVHARLATPGAIDLAGAIRAPELGEVRFAQALTLRRPKVLFLTKDPPGAEVHLSKVLEAAQFELVLAPAGPPENLADFQILVLNNWDLEAVPPAGKAQVEGFVKQGGGLLVIGGENNVYVEHKQAQAEDPLERALPARLAPPRTPEGTCVVLILDKSSSMEGRKIELARMAAIGVIENLRPIDQVGVLIFDNSFHWAVPIRKAEDRSLIKRMVAGVMPDGGTQIAPALQEAYRRIVPTRAVYKHVVLLTDGISEEGDSLTLARDAAASRVTISTVGLGQDVNRAYLEKVALFAKGKAYFMVDPSGL
ncbi:MAG: VWA domain-containing protein, partial [Acidobacteriota bacterium]